MSHPGPIGFFDSGVGGLSVMREVRTLLPGEDLLYFGDNGHCPYGERSEAQVRQRVFHIAAVLVEEGVKLLVVACNTASIVALDDLRARYPQLPIVGMEPAVKPAATATRNDRVGVLATTVALHGERFSDLLRQYARHVEVISLPGHGLVERVEAGLVDDSETESYLRQLLQPLIQSGVDTMVLGCTHYAFLRGLVERVMGPAVTVIDTGGPVARQTRHVLETRALLNPNGAGGQETFYTSGDPVVLGPVVSRLWGQAVSLQYHD